jgi:hypothetical protein
MSSTTNPNTIALKRTYSRLPRTSKRGEWRDSLYRSPDGCGGDIVLIGVYFRSLEDAVGGPARSRLESSCRPEWNPVRAFQSAADPVFGLLLYPPTEVVELELLGKRLA